jgi:hypothetical protein
MSRKISLYYIIYYDFCTFWIKWGKRGGIHIGGEKIDKKLDLNLV